MQSLTTKDYAELIPVQAAKHGDQTVVRVDARALHKALGVGKTFAAWFQNRVKEYGFVEGRDFSPVLGKTSSNDCFPVLESKGCPPNRGTKKRGGHNRIEYSLTLGTAKELAMVERTDLGQQVRRYFIDLEERIASGDVTLAAEIAERATPEKAEWLARRTAGIVARKGLTDTLAQHGVKGPGYALCTNAIYQGVLGATKREVVAQRGLPLTANLRDHLGTEQLIATAMAELVAKKRITTNDATGNAQCASECLTASKAVANLLS